MEIATLEISADYLRALGFTVDLRKGSGVSRSEGHFRIVSLLFDFNGAAVRTRTGDLRFTKALLYQLSYIGKFVITKTAASSS